MIKKVRKSFVEAFGIDPSEFSQDLTPDSIPAWDSFGHLRLVIALQEQFSIEFNIDEIMEMESVEKIVEIISKRAITD
jgi:acyl carrier protein